VPARPCSSSSPAGSRCSVAGGGRARSRRRLPGAQLKAAGAFFAKSFACRAAHKNPLADLTGASKLPVPCLEKAEAKPAALDRATPRGDGLRRRGPQGCSRTGPTSHVFGVSSEAPRPRPDTALHSAHKAIGRGPAGAEAEPEREAPNEVRPREAREGGRLRPRRGDREGRARASPPGPPWDVADEVERIATPRRPDGAAGAPRSRARSSSPLPVSDSDVNDRTRSWSRTTPRSGAADPCP
jgi:hypothetical protein